jgi:hypothetical protein
MRSLRLQHADLLEDGLEVVLDGVRGDEQLRRDVVGRPAARDELGDLALAAGQAVRAEQQRRDVHRRGGLDDHRGAVRRMCDA